MTLDVEIVRQSPDTMIEKGYIGFDGFQVVEKSQVEGEIESFGSYFREKLKLGEYTDLASDENRQFFAEYILLFDEDVQDRLRAEAVTPWLVESYKMTQNIVSDEIPETMKSEEILKTGRVGQALFDQVLDVFSRMAKFKETKDAWNSFAGLEQSPLFGEKGILRIRSTDIFENGQLITGEKRKEIMRNDPYAGRDRNDSLYQQANLVILGMRGLDVPEMDSLFDYAQHERISRAKTGKAPAVMAITLANNRPPSEEEAIRLANRIKYGWGTPPGPGENQETRLVWKKGDVAAAYEALVYAVEHGSPLSERYLAMMGPRKIKDLVRQRQEILAKKTRPGWNRPLWRDPQTGVVTDVDGAVSEPVAKYDLISSQDRGVTAQQSGVWAILGLLGLTKTSKL